MDYEIKASITTKSAVGLVLSGNINLNEVWPSGQARLLLDYLSNMSFEEILQVLDSIEAREFIDVSTIPQFGTVETIIKVPKILMSVGFVAFTCSQLGFYLKEDLNATLAANTKFGETHGKGAALLGLAIYENKRITTSSLTKAFVEISDDMKKEQIVVRLFFRIPIIQTLIIKSKSEKINGYSLMYHLEESTKKRRGQCIRTVLKLMKQTGCKELVARIDNIYWELNEGAKC